MKSKPIPLPTVEYSERPIERTTVPNRKVALIKKGLQLYQYLAPDKTAKIIWSFFTRPRKPRFSEKQQALIESAKISDISYLDCRIVTYRWGTEGPKILLSHGWNSKIADFRKMIEPLLQAGFVVEGIDMKAHGKSEGTHTNLIEVRDILKSYYLKNGPYHAMIGYSFGGIASGIVLGELDPKLLPEHLFIIASPPYVRYFFEDIVKKECGCNEKIYQKMCALVGEYYSHGIDYLDLRKKKYALNTLNLHLIYDEDDQTVPFSRGLDLREAYPYARWVQTKGLGHYQVMVDEEVVGYILRTIKKSVPEESLIV